MSPSMFDLFHRRLEEKNGEIPDTYFYTLTDSFKKRFLMMFDYLFQEKEQYQTYNDNEHIVKALRIAFGVFSLSELSGVHSYKYADEIKLFILKCSDDNKVISAIECICRYALMLSKKGYDRYSIIIHNTNKYFKLDRIGYTFITEGDGFIVFIEDEHFYNECTQKSLSLLTQKGYSNAQNFFIDAYKKLAASDYDDAIVDVGRAIETLLKERFSKLGIPYDDKKDSLNKLLNIAKQHIITPYSFEPFQQTLLEVGRARNQMGAHGVTPGQTPVADELHVRFAINQAAANLLFLAEVPMSNK